MEDSEINSDKNKLFSLTEQFEKYCPFYMALGMSYNEYWYGDSQRAKYYRKAYKIKKEQMNEQLWLQGVYIYEALLDVSPILHAFSSKGTKPAPFPKQPYNLGYLDDLYTKEEKEEMKKAKEEKEVEKERRKAEAYFKSWAKATAKHFENKK